VDKQQKAELFYKTIKKMVNDGATVRLIPSDGEVACTVVLPSDSEVIVGYHSSLSAAVRMAYGTYADYLKRIGSSHSESFALYKLMLSMLDRAVSADSGVEREGFNYKFTGPLTSEWAALYSRERSLATEELFFKRYLLYLIDIISGVEYVAYDLRNTAFELLVGSGADEIHAEVTYDKNDPDRFVKCIISIATVHLNWLGQIMGENHG
jgi:hypothetical protein